MNVRHEGLAASGDWQARQYALLEADGAEPPYTIADAWTPPHPLALDADMVALLLDAAHACKPITTPAGGLPPTRPRRPHHGRHRRYRQGSHGGHR